MGGITVAAPVGFQPGTTAGAVYAPTIGAAAQQYGVPYDVLYNVLGSESSFNPNAYNASSGATGIAQFLPSTAASLGVSPSDPTSSIYGAASYLSTLYNQTGSWPGAYAAYGGFSGGAPAALSTLAASPNTYNQGLYAALTGASATIPPGITGTPAAPAVAATNPTGTGWSLFTAPITTLFSDAADLFERGGVILLGAILVAIALWAMVRNTTAGQAVRSQARRATSGLKATFA